MIPISRWLKDEFEDRGTSQPCGSSVECGSTSPIESAAENYQRGFADGLATGDAEWERKLESERLLIAEATSAERERWHQEEVAKMTVSFDAALNQLQVSVEERVTRILAPFLHRAVVECCMSEFREVVRAHLREKRATCLRIVAPLDFQPALQSLLSEEGTSLEILASPDGEAALDLGDGVLETALMPWLAKLGVEAHG